MNTASPDSARNTRCTPAESRVDAPWPERLAEALRLGTGDSICVVAEGVNLDEATFSTLQQALEADPGLDAVSPVSLTGVRQAWRLDDEANAEREAWTWAPHRPESAPPDPRCTLFTRAGAERAAGGANELRSARLPYWAVALPPMIREPGPSAEHRPQAAKLFLPEPTDAGRDGRPVVLHVLHDWGGGVARFVADQQREDAHATHLALVSRRSGNAFGAHLALYVHLDRCPIRVWRCEPPIGDMTDTHPGVRAALEEIRASFGVSALRVSSLIGSSLDVLRTGLPTAFVVHDAFPFWPWLDDPAGQPVWDPERLANAASEERWLFSETRPAAWRQRATAAITALDEARIPLVAPSRAALSRLARLVPGEVLARAEVIPHGLAPVDAPRATRQPGPLRVLVPGRLHGGKGQRLLDSLLPIVPEGVVWCFAGGGALAVDYAERMGGESIPEYRPEDLPALVARFDPDIALLPSLLPETFGYVLSEMQALNVPVLAANRGAYGERIDAAVHGWPAVAPEAAAFAAALADMAKHPTRLPRALPAPPSAAEALQAWSILQALEAQATRALPMDTLASPRHAQGIRWAEVEQLVRERDAAYAAHGRDTADLAAQRDVAVGQQAEVARELAAARQHAEALTTEREEAQAHRLVLMQENARLSEHVSTLNDHIEQLTAALAATEAARNLAYAYYERDTTDLIRQRDTALSQRDAAQDQLMQAQRILHHPIIRWPLGLARRMSDAAAGWRYRLDRGAGLIRRGLRSLRQRGLGPTLGAVQRRLRPRPAVVHTPSASAQTALRFPEVHTARVSIVIPVYGNLELTLACLRSLLRVGLPADTEVIVIDDASPDDSARVLSTIDGLRYQRNAENLGFVGSCNAGAAMARGEFVVFLNNDTTLTPGWLDALLATFDQHPDTGLVGSQLVYPDGRLQEAGGIVFADGSGWNYGRFEDPRHPAYTFVREVDYCSGAAIALRADLFAELGGFDARYAPAYYEDTDLAMKVREAGLKVRVQPASVVVHHEGATAGTDTGSGIKAYQVRNQQHFVERWRDTLARRHPAPSQAPHYAAQHRARARVLVIDATTPMPDRDSGSLRLFELLQLLVEEGCAVTFFPENGLDDGRYTQALRDMGIEAWTQPWLGALPDWLAKHGARFQLIVVSRHYILSPLLPLLRRHAPQARIVFDTVDLHHLREQREADERDDAALRRTAERTRHDELALIAATDRTWVVSPVEKALLAEAMPSATVDIVSNIHRCRGAGPAMTQRHGLIFVGGFRHPPNVDAARWLAEDILPRIRAVRPDIHLTLVGSDAPDEILALDAQDGIHVLGYVPDLEPVLDAHRFSVAPLRYGAGVKGKVNQALAHGLPVVATRCAVEGMGLIDGVDAIVADTAEAFAERLLAAYDDEALWQRLVAGGLENTQREFSPERARLTLRSIFADLR